MKRKSVLYSISGFAVAVGIMGGIAQARGGGVQSPAKEAVPATGIIIVEYYSEPELIHKVGYCTTVNCPRMPKGRTCSGSQTAYSTVDYDACDGGP